MAELWDRVWQDGKKKSGSCKSVVRSFECIFDNCWLRQHHVVLISGYSNFASVWCYAKWNSWIEIRSMRIMVQVHKMESLFDQVQIFKSYN